MATRFDDYMRHVIEGAKPKKVFWERDECLDRVIVLVGDEGKFAMGEISHFALHGMPQGYKESAELLGRQLAQISENCHLPERHTRGYAWLLERVWSDVLWELPESIVKNANERMRCHELFVDRGESAFAIDSEAEFLAMKDCIVGAIKEALLAPNVQVYGTQYQEES